MVVLTYLALLHNAFGSVPCGRILTITVRHSASFDLTQSILHSQNLAHYSSQIDRQVAGSCCRTEIVASEFCLDCGSMTNDNPML